MNLLKLSLVALATCAIGITGCQDDPKEADKQEEVKEKPFHVHGPYKGGECCRFEGTEDFGAELVVDKNSQFVKIMFCDYDCKNPKMMKADKVVVASTGGEKTPYELQPIKPDEEGNCNGFEIEDKDCRAAAKFAISVTVTVDGKDYVGIVKPH